MANSPPQPRGGHGGAATEGGTTGTPTQSRPRRTLSWHTPTRSERGAGALAYGQLGAGADEPDELELGPGHLGAGRAGEIRRAATYHNLQSLPGSIPAAPPPLQQPHLHTLEQAGVRGGHGRPLSWADHVRVNHGVAGEHLHDPDFASLREIQEKWALASRPAAWVMEMSMRHTAAAQSTSPTLTPDPPLHGPKRRENPLQGHDAGHRARATLDISDGPSRTHHRRELQRDGSSTRLRQLRDEPPPRLRSIGVQRTASNSAIKMGGRGRDWKQHAHKRATQNLNLRPESAASKCLRGLGQVVFLGDALQGLLVLIGLCFSGDPLLVAMAVLGSVVSNVAATWLEFGKGATIEGLAAYNGVLVGCAFSVMLKYEAYWVVLATVIGSMMSVIVAKHLARMMKPVPMWTLPFNIVVISTLAVIEAAQSAQDANSSASQLETGSEWEDARFLLSPLSAQAQIYLVDSPIGGCCILAALLIHSRAACGFALMGAGIGQSLASASGANHGEMVASLWGFNSALTSMSIVIFFRPTKPAIAVAAAGAALTALVFGVLKEILAAWLGVPPCTLPFCITATACFLIGQRHLERYYDAAGSNSTSKAVVVPHGQSMPVPHEHDLPGTDIPLDESFHSVNVVPAPDLSTDLPLDESFHK